MIQPELTREACVRAQEFSLETKCLFISPSSVGGAKQTKSDSAAKEWSIDRINWHLLPNGLSPVTGRMTRGAYAFVFDKLVLQDSGSVDLWDYVNYFHPEKPIKFRMGGSTVCALKKDMHDHSERIKSNKRMLIAVGRLVDPYAIWLRS